MKIPFLFLCIVVLFSCEDDEICTENYTPRFYIDFYEYRNGTDLTIDSFATKSIDTLFIERINSDSSPDYFISTNSSKVLIPLNEVSDSPTLLNLYLSEDASESEKTKIQLNYTKSEKYISKACGFRYEFTNLSYEVLNTGFIDSIAQNSNNITNENTSHISIFH